jgi:aminoglycoside phosphotransferase (APT) family kinase protein
MHSGELTTSGAAAAVVKAARIQLAALDPTAEGAADELAALLAITDTLLARAAHDDDVVERRHAAAQRRRDTGEDVTYRDIVASADAGDDAAMRTLVGDLADTEIGTPPDGDLHLPTPAPTATTGTDAIADYLRARGDTRELVSATGIAGGFSKETILLRLRTDAGDDEDVVLRKVAAGRAADSLADEYGVVRFASAHGLPVAEPLWLDTDGGSLGAPLFATRRMPGRTVGTVTGPTGDATADIARALAEVLGRLHALDVAELTGAPRPAMVTRHDLLSAIAEREKVVQRVADTLPDTPGLALYRALLAWLRTHLPDVDGREVLVHGDVGFHNVLVDDEALTALLDWEVAHRGRPAEDLAYVRPSVATLLDWDEFMRHYTDAGGAAVDEAELRYFTVWQDVWRATSCLRLRTKFVLDPARLADGVSGLLLGVRFLDSALRTAFGIRS